MRTHFTMQGLPESERPYEKLQHRGAEYLSDAELLAIIIKSGTKEYNSTELATMLLSGKHGNLLNLYDYSVEELSRLPGIGRVKSLQLKAVAELSRRISRAERLCGMRMDCPDTVAAYYMETMRHEKTELVVAAFFDSKCHFLGDSVITKGSVSEALLAPREIFRSALLKDAVSIIVLHNHPSGNPSPSNTDIRVTESIVSLGNLIGIAVIDHIIIGDQVYYSFRESGRIPE